MRRAIGITCAIVLTTCAIATTAGGFGGLNENGTNVYRGDVDGGGKFYFEAKYKKGEPKKMGYAIALMVPVDCAEGRVRATFTNEELPLAIPVRKRKFSLDSGEIQEAEFDQTSIPQPFTGRITGKLDEDGKHASGTLDFGAVDLGDEAHGCSTPCTRTWDAKLTTKFAPH